MKILGNILSSCSLHDLAFLSLLISSP